MREKKPPYKPDPEILRKNAHLKDFFPFIHDLGFESDRSSVLLCCAYLDDLLRDTLQAFFVDGAESDRLLGGFNAPLGSFSARTTAAYTCALITELELRELVTLRKIRNEFAHSKTAAFSDQKIADLCANLAYRAPDMEGEPPFAPSTRFTTAAVALIAALTNRPAYVRRERCKPKQLPR
jgi:mannitol operon repressor